jgi:hypothetical protein
VSGLAVTHRVTRVELDASAALAEAWRLYKRLWTRSVLMAGVVFGFLHLLEALVRSGRHGLLLSFLTLVLTIMGTAILQGGLVEVVRGLHDDGDDDPSALEALVGGAGRLGRLVGIALMQGIGVGLGLLLFIVPGLLALTRWAIAVPVAVIEDRKTDASIKRSKEILAGNGLNVFKVIFATGVLTILVGLPFSLASAHAGPLGWWVASTLASMLTAPYAAHALTVVYYALVQPERPVLLEPGQRWHSVWAEQKPEPASNADAAWAEYERRFDDWERRTRS